MKILAGIFLLLSISFFSYPYINEQIQNHKEHQLLEEFNNSFIKSATNQQLTTKTLQQVDSALATSDNDKTVPRVLDANSKKLFTGGVIGLISIAKIDLTLPILEGATQENMKHAATHISETTAFGEIGNAAISAHRAITKGRLFNRLDEVQIGDKLVVRTKDADFTYTVFQKRIVFPVQVSVLNRNNVDSILTLITCDDTPEAATRLIIQAKLDKSVDNKPHNGV
jgi:sortase A